jgi:hypothetical protein
LFHSKKDGIALFTFSKCFTGKKEPLLDTGILKRMSWRELLRKKKKIKWSWRVPQDRSICQRVCARFTGIGSITWGISNGRQITLTFEIFNLDFLDDFVEFLSHEYFQSRFILPIIGLKINTVGIEDRIFLRITPFRLINLPIRLSFVSISNPILHNTINTKCICKRQFLLQEHHPD